MLTLGIDKAHTYVLQVLDELKGLEGMLETDELDTMKLVKGFIVQAIVKAHKDAPAYLVDGNIATQGEDFAVTVTDGVANIVMLQESARLASLKASDSPVVVSDYATVDSPIGRMQNNRYVRGTWDDPRLIIKRAWADMRRPEYLYYSVKDEKATFTLEYVPYPLEDSEEFEIADKLEYAVLNLLAAMVLNALSYADKANIYMAKYQEYLQLSR
jgi:hypothetical protein